MFKKLLTLGLSAILCVSVLALSACTKEEKDLVKALNTMEVDYETAWKLTADVEVNQMVSISSEVSTNNTKAAVTAYATLTEDPNLKGLKADVDFSATESETSGSSLNQSTSQGSSQGKVFVRENGGMLDVYGGNDQLGYMKESTSISEVVGGSDPSMGAQLTPEAQAKIDELVKYLTDNSFLTKAIVDAGATSEMDGKVQIITIDYIAYAKSLLEDVKSVIGSIEQNTTVSDLYANETVKEFIDSHFGSVTADVVYEKVAALAKDMGATIPTDKVPSKDQSVYDYIGELLNIEIEGVKIGNMPVGAEIAVMKQMLIQQLDAIKIQLDSMKLLTKVSIQKGELVGYSLEINLSIPQAGMEGMLSNTTVKVNMDMEKSADYTFTDVSKLTLKQVTYPAPMQVWKQN